MDGRNPLSDTGHERRPVQEADRYVRAERRRNRRPIDTGGQRAVGKANGAQQRGGVRGAPADASGDGKRLLQRYLAQLELRRLLG